MNLITGWRLYFCVTAPMIPMFGRPTSALNSVLDAALHAEMVSYFCLSQNRTKTVLDHDGHSTNKDSKRAMTAVMHLASHSGSCGK